MSSWENQINNANNDISMGGLGSWGFGAYGRSIDTSDRGRERTSSGYETIEEYQRTNVVDLLDLDTNSFTTPGK